MAGLYNRSLRKLLDAWPGKKYFGIYRFLPGFFVFGGLLEFSMINWRVGETNFCNKEKYTQFLLLTATYFPFFIDNTYKKRQAHEIAVKRLTEVN